MVEGKKSLEEFHREIAVKTNNSIWKILDKNSPDEQELDDALGWAFASRYHWSELGSLVNIARADYMISRVFSAMKRGDLALEYANKCLDLIQSKSEIAIQRAQLGLMEKLPEVFADYDLAFAYEAIARAYAILGKREECRFYVDLAKKAISQVQKSEDRKACQSELVKVKCP